MTVSIAAGADVAATERTLNSFLNCCSDLSSVGWFLIVDHALSEADRQRLADIYPFAEISLRCPAEPGQIRSQVHGRYWLHIGEGWQFFATEPYIARLSQVLGRSPMYSPSGSTSTMPTRFRKSPTTGHRLSK